MQRWEKSLKSKKNWKDDIQRENVFSLDLPSGQYVLADPMLVLEQDLDFALGRSSLWATKPYKTDKYGESLKLDGKQMLAFYSLGLSEKLFGNNYKIAKFVDFPIPSGRIGVVDIKLTMPKKNWKTEFFEFSSPCSINLDNFGTISITSGNKEIFFLPTAKFDDILESMYDFVAGKWIAENIDAETIVKTVERYALNGDLNDSYALCSWFKRKGFCGIFLPTIKDFHNEGKLNWTQDFVLPEYLFTSENSADIPCGRPTLTSIADLMLEKFKEENKPRP